MKLMNQPFSGQLGNRLIELLDLPDYHTFNIVVAFAKNSGVLRIKDSLEQFRKRGGVVNAYVGVDLGGTSYEALTTLLLHTDSLVVMHSERGQTFHSKIYQFLGEKDGLLVVGSHNMTGGGLWTNFESSVHIPIGGTRADDSTANKELAEYFQQLSSLKDSFMQITTQGQIDTLLKNDYVVKEIADRVRRAKAAKKNGIKDRLFGKGAPANLPRIAPLKKERTREVYKAITKTNSTVTKDEKLTIWFETREMTGGSRNILDLSKKSLIEQGDPTNTPFDLGEAKFMRGGVEFFGLSPTVTDQTKNITLNFEGADYAENTVLYPAGANANGTWRLQIKGVDSSNRKITEAFRAKSDDLYLVKKVITFTKIQGDYFFMSVFPETELENFKAASSILARNGTSRNARYLGLL